ncbi:hypothetical protein D3C80_1404130 [compost metagenome]
MDPVLLKRQQPLTTEFVHVGLVSEVRHAGRERSAQLAEQVVEDLSHLLDRCTLFVLLRQVVGNAAHLLAVMVTHLLCKRFHGITPWIQSVLLKSRPGLSERCVPPALRCIVSLSHCLRRLAGQRMFVCQKWSLLAQSYREQIS